MLRRVIGPILILVATGCVFGQASADIKFKFLKGRKPLTNRPFDPRSHWREKQPEPALYTFKTDGAKLVKTAHKELKALGYMELHLYVGGHNYHLALPHKQKEIRVDIELDHTMSKTDPNYEYRKGWVVVRVWVTNVRR